MCELWNCNNSSLWLGCRLCTSCSWQQTHGLEHDFPKVKATHSSMISWIVLACLIPRVTEAWRWSSALTGTSPTSKEPTPTKHQLAVAQSLRNRALQYRLSHALGHHLRHQIAQASNHSWFQVPATPRWQFTLGNLNQCSFSLINFRRFHNHSPTTFYPDLKVWRSQIGTGSIFINLGGSKLLKHLKQSHQPVLDLYSRYRTSTQLPIQMISRP